MMADEVKSPAATHEPKPTANTPTPFAVQTVSAASPKFTFTMLTSGNVLVRVYDTSLAFSWQVVISAANWALLAAMSGAGSFMQFTVQSGGQVAPQAPA